MVSVRKNLSSRLVMEEAYEFGELLWTSEFEKNGPESLSVQIRKLF